MSIAIALSALVALVPPSGPLERALGLLDALDARTITVDYEHEDLEDVLRDLDDRLSLSIRADWDALDRLAVGRYEPIDLAFDAAPASTVLAAIAARLGDEFERPVVEAHAGQIVLTTVVGSAAMRVTDVYDVRDLLARAGTVEELRATRPGAEPLPSDADPDAEPGLDPDSAPTASTARTPGTELMLLVAEHVDPDAWIDFGGMRARLDERDGVVLVTAPPSVHRKFRDALRRLRRANPSALAVEATLLDLPRETYDRLARRHEPTSAELGRALLLAADATVRWSTTNGVAIGSTLAIDTTRDGVQIRLDLAPEVERERGMLLLDVAIETTEAEDRRRVRTGIAVPMRRGGAVVELPAAAAGGTVRLLVVVPEGR